MKLKELQDAMIAAMKAKDKFRKDAIAALVSAVKKKGIDAGCREDIPDEMANEAILKEIKSVKEQIDTCPADRTELLEEYKKRYEIMSEFAPKMLSAEEVAAILQEKFADVLATKNKGQIMKAVMGELKGKADGKVINQVVADLTKQISYAIKKGRLFRPFSFIYDTALLHIDAVCQIFLRPIHILQCISSVCCFFFFCDLADDFCRVAKSQASIRYMGILCH